MLSDEEKKAINDLNFIIVTDIYDNEVSIDKTKIINEYNESVGIVLNLIKKQSKEIEELKEKNNKLMEELDLTTVYISGVYDGEKKVEDKIKAKIEELEKGNKNTFIRGEKILVLQSLLEKE